MPPIYRNALIILVSIVIAAIAIIPPEKQLRRGKDLAGGVTLVYTVAVQPGEDAAGVLSRTIEVLKQRVDPSGTMEISMIPVGSDRIEVSMPLPSERVKRLKAAFEEELAKLSSGALQPEQVDRIAAMPEAERAGAIASAARGDAGRSELLTAAVAAHDAMRAARQAFDAQAPELEARVDAARRVVDAARAGGADAAALEPLESALRAAEEALAAAADVPAQASEAYEAARSKAAGTTISAVEVRRALERSNVRRRIADEQTRTVEELPSPREAALTRLRSAHPGAEAALTSVVAAWDRYESERSTLDDPSDLIRILRGAGVLHFRIAVKPGQLAQEAQLRADVARLGPQNVRDPEVRWYKLNKLDRWYKSRQDLDRLLADAPQYFRERYGYVVEPYDGEFWMLLWDVPGNRLTESEGQWGLAGASAGPDDLGRPAIHFRMDAVGAARMGELTGAHVNDPMAILLDDEVYTAATINSRIGGQGIIQGEFERAEVDYVVRVLTAGSLQAKLSPEPISVNTMGPELGADNLRRGLYAGVISFIAVSAFMIGYYFLCGAISVFALLVNLLLLLAAMALNKAAFSLPGIAGVILTFGQAVDANVLVYERMREELDRGSDLRTAVRLGHKRALNSIVDGNVTTLLVCVVLGFLGTQEIRGFAITLTIGILTTLFAQLFLARTIFDFLVGVVGWRRTSMLPMAVPALNRVLTPSIDWMRYRHVFFSISLVLTGLGAGVIALGWSDLLDSEFKGGTKVTIQLRAGPDGEPMTLTRRDVEERVRAIADRADHPEYVEFQNAEVVVINPRQNGVSSDRFEIKTTMRDGQAAQEAIVEEFADVIESQPRLRFESSDADARSAPVFPIVSQALGESLELPDVRTPVGEFVGGAAIVVRGLEPPPSAASIATRLTQLREQPDYSDTAGRAQRVVVLEGTEDAVKAAAILVRDPNASFFESQDVWERELRNREWALVNDALSRSTTLANVQSFSPAIARTFAAQAVVSIVLATLMVTIYIWVRFNSLRFSLAAILTTLHDCFVAIAFIAFASMLNDHAPQVAASLGILPFKIDLNVVAAVLTVLGYSLNDTIIVMDRIRENRGKLAYSTREVINNSINQTISRTLITSGTTVIAVVVLYLLAGPAVRSFAYIMLVGVAVGTYSSIAVAAPIVWVRSADKSLAGTLAPRGTAPA